MGTVARRSCSDVSWRSLGIGLCVGGLASIGAAAAAWCSKIDFDLHGRIALSTAGPTCLLLGRWIYRRVAAKRPTLSTPLTPIETVRLRTLIRTSTLAAGEKRSLASQVSFSRAEAFSLIWRIKRARALMRYEAELADVRKIQASYLSEPEAEINRLKAAAIPMERTEFMASQWERVLFGRAEEMARYYRTRGYKTYFTASDQKWAVVADMVHARSSMVNTTRPSELHRVLRIPRKHLGYKTPSELAAKLLKGGSNDHTLRADLISAVQYALDPESGESPHSFITRNESMASTDSSLLNKHNFTQNPPGWQVQIESDDSLIRLANERQAYRRADKLGVLNLICIPADESSKITYSSHPLGRLCKKPRVPEPLVDQFIVPPGKCHCGAGSNPQVRILPQFLLRSRKSRVIRFCHWSAAEEAPFKERAHQVAVDLRAIDTAARKAT